MGTLPGKPKPAFGSNRSSFQSTRPSNSDLEEIDDEQELMDLKAHAAFSKSAKVSPTRLLKSETKKAPMIRINANMLDIDQISDESEGDFARELKKRVFSARQRMVARPCYRGHGQSISRESNKLETALRPNIFERAHVIP